MQAAKLGAAWTFTAKLKVHAVHSLADTSEHWEIFTTKTNALTACTKLYRIQDTIARSCESLSASSLLLASVEREVSSSSLN